VRIVSVNVGRPRSVLAGGKAVRTGIFKSPVAGRVRVRELGFEGDGQADPRVHGGVEKAVYLYPSEHYPFWSGEWPGVPLPWGAFGENLDIEGLDETSAHVGDELRAGTARLRITGPRLPCFKLGVKFESPAILATFLQSQRTGFYAAVTLEGEVAAGDMLEVVHRDPHAVSIHDVVRLESSDRHDRELLERVLACQALPESWRRRFSKRRLAGA
jgi:MOSC domain-containing protein YiiM